MGRYDRKAVQRQAQGHRGSYDCSRSRRYTFRQ
nr:MAG TPA: hypothetical protein [Caudoviricetes sp.]